MVSVVRRAWSWWYRTDWAIGLTVFLVAALPRLIPSGTFMDPDSAAEWLPRTRGFIEALHGGDPKLFSPDIHPGVTLMWLTSAGFSLWRVIGSWFTGWDIVEAFTWVIKMPVAFVTSLLVVMSWSLLRRLLDRTTAVLIAMLFAIDPLYLVFSRYLHLDALVTGFVFTGLLAVWLGVTQGRARAVMLGSVLLSLGVLTRFNGVIAVFIAIGCFFWSTPKRGRGKLLVAFLSAGLLTTMIVWPAILFGPAGIVNLLNNRIGLALVSHEVPPMVDVIPLVRALLYPLFILTREFSVFIMAAIIGLITFPQWPVATKRLGLVLGTFSVVYYLALLMAPKDLDRYALPLIGPLIVFSAMGWQWTWRRFYRPIGRAAIVAMLLLQLISFYRLAPYFQTYQNWMTNVLRHSPVRTSQALDPAWGEGIAEAVTYLKNGRESLPATAAWFAGIVCYYGHDHIVTNYPIHGGTRLECPAGLRLLEYPQSAEYLLLSRDQIKQRIYPKLIDDIRRLGWQPEKIITINGVPIIYLYKNFGGLAERYSLTGQ